MSADTKPARRDRRIAVLGAGIMGSSLALVLARRGYDVTLIDAAERPVSAASRWNEGKIHLGYLYSGDPTLQTARHMIPGGIAFAKLLSELTQADVMPHATGEDDVFVVHRRSVVPPDRMESYLDEVTQLLRSVPGANAYLTDLSKARVMRLSRAELSALSPSQDILAGFRVPERSINTQWVADALANALAGERLRLQLGTTVERVTPLDGINGRWHITGTPSFGETFDLVINALWNGRLPIDMTAGLSPEEGWSSRYRLALFVRTRRSLPNIESALIAVGPFGDIKNYDGRRFYLSWYPVGLRAEHNGPWLAAPPPLDESQSRQFIADVGHGLSRHLPGAGAILDEAEDIKIRGGFVVALGQGSLADPRSTIHRRDRFGVRRMGNYLSVDTGKYSTAPWLALKVAGMIGAD